MEPQTIHDLIQTAPLEVSEESIKRLYQIAQALNDRLDALHSGLLKADGRAFQAELMAIKVSKSIQPN